MDNWIALILGMVQGLTEFFPVSSSGHLMLLENLFGLKEDTLLFNIICHLGTLGSIITVFFKDLKHLGKSEWLKVGIATLPLFPCALFLKDIRWLFSQPQYLGFFFCCTALILYLSEIKIAHLRMTKRASFAIGLSQAVALFPGVSRSGTTMSFGRMLGWSPESAMKFSFLMAIPAILGSATLESYKWIKEGSSPIDLMPALIGFISSYFFGLVALYTLKQLVRRAKIRYFAWYCLGLGALSLWLFR